MNTDPQTWKEKLPSVGDPWNFGAGPYLWLIDPDPDPTTDPTLFFSDFKDAKNPILITYPQAHYFSPLNTFIRKGKIQVRIRTSD